jgi:arylsulfatase A-like enzyme
MTRFSSALLLLLLLRVSLPAEDRPNFIVIFVDDQGYGDLGCFGSPTIRSPHIDRMATEGMRFTSFYSAAAICSPSRAALLTGCYPRRVGLTRVLFPFDRIGLNPAEVTIAEVLKARGYATSCVGKWHLGHLPEFLPTAQGFDSYFGVPYSNDMDRVEIPGVSTEWDEAWRRNQYAGWNVPLLRDETEVERPTNQITLTERYTDEAIRFVETHRDAPFFLYLAHTMPHVPLFVSEEFYTPDPLQAYARTIAEIDASVGKLLAALRRLEISDRTLVVYTSDNGPWLSKKHHGGSAGALRGGKFGTHEGGMREPCVMLWPDTIPAGTVCDEVASTIDLLPTFASLAGATLPDDRIIDGKDIGPLLRGEPGARSPHERYYYYRKNDLEAVRSGKWKLRRAAEGEAQLELYDLDADVGESKNLAAEEPERAAQLVAAMEAFDTRLKAKARDVGVSASLPYETIVLTSHDIDYFNLPVTVRVPLEANDAPVRLRDEATGELVRTQRDAVGRHSALSFVVDSLPAGTVRRYRIEPDERTTSGEPQGVELRAEGDRLDVLIDGELFTTYHGDDGQRPYCWPVIGPTGKSVTRNYPMRTDVPGESRDHDHHRSFWFGYDKVNGHDFWRAGRQTTHHQEFVSIKSGPVYGEFAARVAWVTRDGQRVCEDVRRFRIWRTRGARVVDATVDLLATNGPVQLGDSEEGMFAFRVASSMKVASGGTLRNAAGQTNGDAWGKRSPWCDYSGNLEGETVGVSILDHPENLRHPTYWHVRPYGLFCANRFGVRDFTGEGDGSHLIADGESLRQRYRVYIHRGDAVEARVGDFYKGYAQRPQVALE